MEGVTYDLKLSFRLTVERVQKALINFGDKRALLFHITHCDHSECSSNLIEDFPGKEPSNKFLGCQE